MRGVHCARPLATALAVAGALAFAGGARVALAQTSEEPDRTILITTQLGVDDPTSSFYPGSLYQAIRLGNDATSEPDVDYVRLQVFDSLLNLTTTVVDPLPAIDLDTANAPGARVDLDGSFAPNFRIRSAADVAADFVLLHVMSGRADLVDLDLRSGLLDSEGRVVPLTVQVDTGATLGFRYTRDFAFEENMTGGGGVRVETAGVLFLSGSNDYTGGTQVVRGTLAGDEVALPGDFVLDAEGALRFEITDITTDALYAGNVSGAGRVEKSGPGTLVLSGGVASHTGGTRVDRGTLRATPDSLTGRVTIASGAAFVLDQTGATPFAGAIDGDGAVTKTGALELALTGTNSFRGGLTVEVGNVRGTTASIPGNVTLAASTQLILDQDTDGTHTGTISSPVDAPRGDLIKLGSGRVLRQGVTDVGMAQIQAGTLAGDAASHNARIAVSSGAVAEFALSNTQSYGGQIDGLGRVLKTGTGTLVVTSNLQHLDTTVAGGTLQLEAALSGAGVVRVESGGRLQNNGGSIAGDLVNLGRVAPGGTGSALTVGGDATLESGSVLEVVVDRGGNASLLGVSGAATLNGPTWAFTLVPGDYSSPVTFTALQAASITVNQLGTALDDLAFVDVTGPTLVPALPAVPTSVDFTVQEDFTNLASLGTTPNQVATAGALEQVTSSGSADARAIRDGLVPLRTNEVPGVLDALAGETLVGFTDARIQQARAFGAALGRRLAAGSFELTPAPTAPPYVPGAELPPIESARARSGPGVWLEPFGLFGTSSGEGNASDLDRDAFGFAGGFDYRHESGRRGHTSSLRVGAGLGYAHHWLENARGTTDGSGDSLQGALYAGWHGGTFHAGAAGLFGWSGLAVDRRIAFTSVDRLAKARFDGLSWGAQVEAGAHVGDPRQLRLHPLARFQYLHTEQSGFSEEGAGELSLSVPELEFDSLLLTLGASASRLFTLRGEYGIEPELRAFWLADFGDLARAVPATFYAVPGATPFVTTGSEPDGHAAALGAGYRMRLTDAALVTTHYDVVLGSRTTTHVLSAGIWLRF